MCPAGAPAEASPLDIVGLGSRRAGEANTGLASVDDASALYYNPAGLVAHAACRLEQEPEGDYDESPDPICVERDRGDFIIGVTGAYSHLAINKVRAPFNDAGGAQLAARARITERFALAFAFHGPSQGGVHADVRDPEYPLYPYYRDRLSRPVLLVGAATSLSDAARAGAALDLGAGTSHPKAIAGVTLRVSPSLQAGVVWRQRFAIIDDTTGARVHYTPHTVLAGLTFANDAIRASVDAGFAHWSAYKGPFGSDSTVRVPYKSTGQLRLGLESNKDVGVSFRVGYAFESAAVPPTQPTSNLLDGSKQTVAGGMSYGQGNIRVDAYVGLQIVGSRSMTDPDDTTLKSGGEIFTAGLSLAVGY
ncbi:MAG TPA: hypothetical protein VMZ53_29590 [Kofleriaceae bacterium]|nr:hypothetical protein [Kofleriaceae bacterium]